MVLRHIRPRRASLNALINSCNQKSSSDPVMNLDEASQYCAFCRDDRSCRRSARRTEFWIARDGRQLLLAPV
jgi:hypothetical protein